MICSHASSGCNYPEGECNGDCCRDHHGLESLYQELGKPALFWPIFLSLIAAALLYASIVRDGISETETAQALADEAAAAQHEKDAAALRFDNAARAICGGPEASYIQLENGVIQCVNKQGRKTKTIPGLARPDNTTPDHAARAKGARLQREVLKSTHVNQPAGVVPAGFLGSNT